MVSCDSGVGADGWIIVGPVMMVVLATFPPIPTPPSPACTDFGSSFAGDFLALVIFPHIEIGLPLL